MSIEINDIVEVKVTHIAKFGAFVTLDGGKEGLIHISEISHDYVTDINDYVAVGDPVKVKIVGINKQGKYELSIKQTKDKSPEQEKPAHKPSTKPSFSKPSFNKPPVKTFVKREVLSDEFEDKITAYLKRSEEKQIDIRRNLKKKQGISKKKR